jgi:hypothetical protein
LRGDERWVEDDIGFVDFKVVGAGILKISKHERTKLRKKTRQKVNTKMIGGRLRGAEE